MSSSSTRFQCGLVGDLDRQSATVVASAGAPVATEATRPHRRRRRRCSSCRPTEVERTTARRCGPAWEVGVGPALGPLRVDITQRAARHSVAHARQADGDPMQDAGRRREVHSLALAEDHDLAHWTRGRERAPVHHVGGHRLANGAAHPLLGPDEGRRLLRGPPAGRRHGHSEVDSHRVGAQECHRADGAPADRRPPASRVLPHHRQAHRAPDHQEGEEVTNEAVVQESEYQERAGRKSRGCQGDDHQPHPQR